MSTFSLLSSTPGTAAIACGLLGALTDLRTRRIPNWLTGYGMLSGLLLHLCMGGWRGAANSLGALLLCGVAFLIPYVAGGLGAGDVKLIAAVASLLGLAGSPSLLIYTVLSGGLMGLAVAVAHGRLRETAFNVLRLTLHHSQKGLHPHPDLNVRNEHTLRLPYGVAIASGCCISVFLHASLWLAL